jgi:hypothetical protein
LFWAKKFCRPPRFGRTGAPERSRDRSLAARDRTSSRLDIPTWAQERTAVLEAIHTWEEERAPVLEAIRGLREWAEALTDQLAELRWQQLGTSFGTQRAAYRALKRWGDAQPAKMEEEESLERKRLQRENDA